MLRSKKNNPHVHLDMAEDEGLIQKTRKKTLVIGIILFVSVLAVFFTCLALVLGLQGCK